MIAGFLVRGKTLNFKLKKKKKKAVIVQKMTKVSFRKVGFLVAPRKNKC